MLGPPIYEMEFSLKTTFVCVQKRIWTIECVGIYLYINFIVGKTIGRRLDVNRSELHSVQVNLATVHEGW